MRMLVRLPLLRPRSAAFYFAKPPFRLLIQSYARTMFARKLASMEAEMKEWREWMEIGFPTDFVPGTIKRSGKWCAVAGLNCRPLQCQCSALPLS